MAPDEGDRRPGETIEGWLTRIGCWEHECDQCPNEHTYWVINRNVASWDELALEMDSWRQHLQAHETGEI